MARLTKADAARQLGIAHTTHRAGAPVVYILAEHLSAPLCKIGLTTNLARRLSALRTASPLHLRVICTWDMPSLEEASRLERILLDSFRSYRVRGEWFKIAPDKLLKMFYADFRTEQERLHNRWLQLCARESRVRAVRWQSRLDKQDVDRAKRIYTRICGQLDRVSDAWWARTMQMLCACHIRS